LSFHHDGVATYNFHSNIIYSFSQSTVGTCTRSAPLKKIVIFTLSAPIRIPLNTVPTLDHCALIIFFGAMETRNEYFATLEIGVHNRVRKREIIPVRAGAQLCAIA
jgi:hypothetical protein